MTVSKPTCRPKPDTQRVFPAFSAIRYGTDSADSARFGFFGLRGRGAGSLSGRLSRPPKKALPANPSASNHHEVVSLRLQSRAGEVQRIVRKAEMTRATWRTDTSTDSRIARRLEPGGALCPRCSDVTPIFDGSAATACQRCGEVFAPIGRHAPNQSPRQRAPIASSAITKRR